jgi:hypothetical protein
VLFLLVGAKRRQVAAPRVLGSALCAWIGAEAAAPPGDSRQERLDDAAPDPIGRRRSPARPAASNLDRTCRANAGTNPERIVRAAIAVRGAG